MGMIFQFALGLVPTSWRIAGMAIAAAVVLGMTYLTGRSHGADSVQAKWDAERVQQAAIAAAAEQQSRNKERQMQQQLDEARHAHAEREKKLRADYAAVHAAALGLRDTVAARRSELPAATESTARATADAALAVFGECAAAVGALAAAADGHATDAQLCRDAWPE